MSRRQILRAQAQRLVQQQFVANVPIAHQARIGRAARRVLVDEVIDHRRLERIGDVDQIERNAQLIGNRARRIDIGGRAAPIGPAAFAVAPQLQHEAHDVVALLFQQRRRDRTIDAAAHGHDDADVGSWTARCAGVEIGNWITRHSSLVTHHALRSCSTTRGSTSNTVAISSGCRQMPQRHAQRTQRPLARKTHREQDVRRLGLARRAGRAGADADAFQIERHQQRLAFHAFHGKRRAVGQTPRGMSRELHFGNALEHTRHQLIAQRGHARIFRFRAVPAPTSTPSPARRSPPRSPCRAAARARARRPSTPRSVPCPIGRTTPPRPSARKTCAPTTPADRRCKRSTLRFSCPPACTASV